MKRYAESLVALLLSCGVFVSQAAWADEPEIQNLEAHEALDEVIQRFPFGDYAFDKAQIVTMKENDQVPGLGGLAFAFYRNEETGKRIQVSLQWFEDRKSLDKFYAKQRADDKGLEEKAVDDETSILALEQDEIKAYQWADGEHLLITLADPEVPMEMVGIYLEAISSDVKAMEAALEEEEAEAEDEVEEG